MGDSSGCLALLRSGWSRTFIRSLSASWASWAAFADHHGIDPHQPVDTDLVAFVRARALAGATWGTIYRSLAAVRLAVEGQARLSDAGSLTVAAQRHLTDLFNEGSFDAAWQAPVITVADVVAMVEASEPRDAFLVAVTYLAGMRPGEWTQVDVEHAQIDGRGVRLWLPQTKTGTWQRVRVQPLPGSALDVASLGRAWLDTRGVEPGPLMCDSSGGRLGAEHLYSLLVAAAARAGVRDFTPYSLRRSMAVHADLLGLDSRVIRQRLRHRRDTDTYRRYIEPLLALMDREGAAARYLGTDPGVREPIKVGEVSGGKRSVAAAYAFAAGNVEELLEGLDIPSLRVPKRLVDVSRGAIENGQALFRTWAHWCRDQGLDPTDPPESALTRWVVGRLNKVTAVTVEGNLSSLRLGWVDATGRDEMPGYVMAYTVAHAAAEEERAERAPRFKSRPATSGDRAAVCAAVAVGEPPVGWAVTCLAWACGASSTVEVVGVGVDTAVVLADGVETTVRAGSHGLLDPVTAAERLGAGEVFPVGGTRSESDVVKAGLSHSRALRARLAVVLVAGSGARPSDVARARVSRVEEAPGGLAVFLGTPKGWKPGKTGRDRLIWVPHREGVEDPVAAWRDWVAWHPASADGPLCPADLEELAPRKPWSAGSVGTAVKEAAEGLDPITAYGFRYGRAQEMHDAGLSDETVAEALGHEDLRVTRGYIQGFDPFADGEDTTFVEGISK